mmetsp:Transcript_22828/g.73036  ORF Transcript_22828/g.73036 Transcript_22828/m.73036 type:complete len:156 (-) Transcript_22828:58-525(-)
MGVNTTVPRKRTQTDFHAPFSTSKGPSDETLRDQSTGSKRLPGQRVDACQNPSCVTERREHAATRVELSEKRQELARLRAGLREVIDECAAGDHRLAVGAQSFQLALMEILDGVGEEEREEGAEVEGAVAQPTDAAAAREEGGGSGGGEQQQQQQ